MGTSTLVPELGGGRGVTQARARPPLQLAQGSEGPRRGVRAGPGDGPEQPASSQSFFEAPTSSERFSECRVLCYKYLMFLTIKIPHTHHVPNLSKTRSLGRPAGFKALQCPGVHTHPGGRRLSRSGGRRQNRQEGAAGPASQGCGPPCAGPGGVQGCWAGGPGPRCLGRGLLAGGLVHRAWGGSCFLGGLVHGAWGGACLQGAWSMVLGSGPASWGAWSLVPGAGPAVLGAWSMVPGAVPASWGAWSMVPGAAPACWRAGPRCLGSTVQRLLCSEGPLYPEVSAGLWGGSSLPWGVCCGGAACSPELGWQAGLPLSFRAPLTEEGGL